MTSINETPTDHCMMCDCLLPNENPFWPLCEDCWQQCAQEADEALRDLDQK